jgi:hypothetical protein
MTTSLQSNPNSINSSKEKKLQSLVEPEDAADVTD